MLKALASKMSESSNIYLFMILEALLKLMMVKVSFITWCKASYSSCEL